jgi:hypothetical protein
MLKVLSRSKIFFGGVIRVFKYSSCTVTNMFCYKHVLQLRLYMIMLVFVYTFIFVSVFHLGEKTQGFCVSDPGLLHLTCDNCIHLSSNHISLFLMAE